MGNKCGSGQEVSQEEPKIIVYVKSAQGLPGVDWFPGVDRFLHFGVGADAGGDEFFKSQPKKNVMDPVWNEEFEVPANMPLKFTVFQADADGKEDVVACATLHLAATGEDQFNGELPLEIDGNPTNSVLILKAKTGGGYPTEQGSEFIVSIDNPKKKTLGLEVDNADPAKLFVVGVKKGTVMDGYNGEQPENKVEAGCFIMRVSAADAGNSAVSGSQAMEKILKKSPKQVDLVCKRAKQFRVPLTLAEKGDVGVQLPKRPLGNSLLVTEVKANGAVEAWNAENPDQIIEPWDRIVAVDGKSGKVAELQKLIKAAQKSGKVVLTIIRVASEVLSEEAAPEAAPEVAPAETVAP
eukprot:CAMPEP_0172778666 /NCGR_PEP_ID=MMETSP1074-20121228/202029_1 /TAXON_ID=2916 /ORGANISM="Ceratium fusus, Strain PA161109" /LENGTH=351 /DNA_ID=CAMNT_0013615613 /DNA_START=6 /DNA_END=1061 /DNA_ORIENTATION=+